MNDYNTYMDTDYVSDLEYLKQFIFSFGSNYSLGVKLFPKKIREQTIIFYALVRYADELVDNPDTDFPGKTHDSLEEYIAQWNQVIISGPNSETHPTLRANYWIFLRNNIPFDYVKDFFTAMQQDLVQTRYERYVDLEKYMWGSAVIVGHVMTFFVGYTDSVAFEHARALGEAMQLANILRDVADDYQTRNRIYLPQRDMQVFGVDGTMISDKKMTNELGNFIRHYVQRTELLFSKGISGISYLKKGKFSILLASRMYRENIRILAEQDYDIFGPKIQLSKWRKFWMLITTIVIYPFWRLGLRK